MVTMTEAQLAELLAIATREAELGASDKPAELAAAAGLRDGVNGILAACGVNLDYFSDEWAAAADALDRRLALEKSAEERRSGTKNFLADLVCGHLRNSYVLDRAEELMREVPPVSPAGNEDEWETTVTLGDGRRYRVLAEAVA